MYMNILRLDNVLFLKIQDLVNPEKGWYDEATDSIILYMRIAAKSPQGLK
jgi:hypothetical protein